MQDEWATFGTDLHLELAGNRLRSGLERALRDGVRTGRLRPGTRLPSSRSLARDLGIARNTVADAYVQLVAEGWLTSRHGSGTFVADHPTTIAPGHVAPSPAVSPMRFDLRPGRPDLGSFPRAAWLSAMRAAVQAAPYEAFGYGDARGMPRLRQSLASYLGRARGVEADPEHIVVCSGFSDGLALLCEGLAARGVTVLATEGVGHTFHRTIVRRHGLRHAFLPVDDDGAVVDDMDGAGAALLTPAHQFPLGVPLHPDRRRRVTRWAAETGAVVIEDDYDGEFRYDRQAVGAMQALAPDHVVYAGTTSKSLAPGLRLGWLVVPPTLVEDLLEARAATGRTTSALDQLALAEMISSGAYDRHVRAARLATRRRRDRLVATLAEKAPAVTVTGIAAGHHAVIRLAPGDDEDSAMARAAANGVAVAALRAYATETVDLGPSVVVGYATPPEHAYPAAISRLAAALGRS